MLITGIDLEGGRRPHKIDFLFNFYTNDFKVFLFLTSKSALKLLSKFESTDTVILPPDVRMSTL